MPSLTRRSLLAGAAALMATGARGQAGLEENIILRRTREPGEDPLFYDLGQQGPYNVLPDPIVVPLGRGRTVVNRPLGRAGGPLLVFSHGALADPLAYRQLLRHWASHGFVVAAPVHDDSIFESGMSARLAEARGASSWEVDRFLNDAYAWEARTEACRNVLEHPDLLSAAIDFEVDATRPLIAGHEFGAFVVQLLLGASVTDDKGEQRTFADDRWFAGCILSGQGSGIMGLSESSWDRVARPLLVVQGGLETDYTRQEPIERIAAFTKSMPGNKHLAWFANGRRNLYLGPSAGRAGDELQLFEDLKGVSTGFLRAYAELDDGLFQKIASDWPDRASLGRVAMRYR